MGDNTLFNLFEEAGKVFDGGKFEGFVRDRNELAEIRAIKAMKHFKRKALGLCGMDSYKTLDEMAELLHQTGLARSVEVGRELAPKLNGKEIHYSMWGSTSTYLKFETLFNHKDEKLYHVYLYTVDYA